MQRRLELAGMRSAPTRKQARLLGYTRYNGKPCPKHGVVPRFVANGDCPRCDVARDFADNNNKMIAIDHLKEARDNYDNNYWNSLGV